MEKQSSYRVKVCGMREHANIQSLVAVQPDYIGYIFYPKSKRYVGANPAMEIFTSVPASIKKVGVFVNEDLESIVEKVQTYALQTVQLHGGESEDYCNGLKDLGVEIVKTFSVQNELPLDVMERYTGFVDYFLFDTKTTQFGGSGEKFNWSILAQYNLQKPVFLSGGIKKDDAQPLKNMNLPFVEVLDINSRFELEPGFKNIQAVKEFIEIVRV